MNPETGPLLRIGEVTDLREFQRFGRDARFPSAKGGSAPPELAARIVARRGDAARPKGNLLLAEGVTVVDVVRQALTRGFREAGFRVLSPDDPRPALVVDADVLNFWGRLRLRGVAEFDFEMCVVVKTRVGTIAPGDELRGRSSRIAGGESNHSWRALIDTGLQDFVANLRGRASEQTVAHPLVGLCDKPNRDRIGS